MVKLSIKITQPRSINFGKKSKLKKYEESAFFKMAKKENQDYQTLF